MARTNTPRWHVPSIDALRVLLCLYIVVFHAHLQAYGEYHFGPLSQGISAVNVFFVISGFVLASSFLRSNESFEGGISSYAERRAARLLPLYYACLMASVASVVAFGIPRPAEGLTPATLLAHVLLVQNFFPDDVSYAVNSTYWFVAVEAQLYVLFPFLALSWKRHGGVPTALAVVSVVGVAWFIARGGQLFARPQLAAIFFLGMAAAYVVPRAASKAAFAKTASRVAFAALLLSCCAFAWAYVGRGLAGGLPLRELVRDLASGVAGAAVLVGVSLPGRWKAAKRVLEHRAFAILAPFTYAAYMSHDLLFRLVRTFVLAPSGVESHAMFASLLGIGLPAVCCAAWALRRGVEEPFLRAFAGRKS